MKKIIGLLLLTFFQCENAYSKMTPAVYGAASIIPGLGQTLQGEVWEGLAWFGASVGLIGTGDYKLQLVGQNILFYNMYDAWKDAGGKPSTPKDTAIYNYAQNFNPTHVIDPYALSFLSVAALSRNSARDEALKEDNDFKRRVVTTNTLKSIGLFTFVGFGEEALFRGFLFPAFSSWAGTWGGAILSSTIFGFVHQGNRTANWFRALSGFAFCFQYRRNKYRLGGNIFTHSWYDQLLIGPMTIDPVGHERLLKGDKLTLKDRPTGIQITTFF